MKSTTQLGAVVEGVEVEVEVEVYKPSTPVHALTTRRNQRPHVSVESAMGQATANHCGNKSALYTSRWRNIPPTPLP